MIGIALVSVSTTGVQLALFSASSGILLSISLILSSLGLLFLTSGAGIFLIDNVEHALARKDAKFSQLGVGLSSLEQSTEPSQNNSFEERRLNTKLSIIVFLQGFLLLALFAGLVEEYGSNLTMQEWVNSSFSLARIFLTWQAVLASAFMMGLLVVYCLLGRNLDF